MKMGVIMRQLLIALMALGLMTACSDEPEQKAQEQENATEHTIEQSAEQAASGMEAAGEEVEVVTEAADDAGDAMAEATEEAQQAADEAAQAVEETAEAAEAQVEEVADQVAGREPKEIYNTYCVACHASGVAGAPKLGDTQAWQSRLDARGHDGLVRNSLDGFKAMPAKGTCGDCSDDEIEATVDWMLAESGL